LPLLDRQTSSEQELCMKSLIAAFTFLALIGCPGLASAQDHHSARSPKTDLHVSTAVIVGTTTLKPGDYTFQCVDIDGRQFLVVKDSDGDEAARVPCEAQMLPAKVSTSEFRSVTRDGKMYLTAVRIKGETIAHRVVPNPAG
jgi:hypothetical protein